MTASRSRRAVRVAVLAAVVLVAQLAATPASAAPTPLPPVCTPDFSPVNCDPSIIALSGLDVPTPGVLNGESGLSPDPIGLVGLETWFAFLGINGDRGQLTGDISLCQNWYAITIFGIQVPVSPWGVTYPWLGPCPTVPPAGTPGTPGAPWFCLAFCANYVQTVGGPFNASLYFFLGILPAGYDVDFASPDETGNTVQSVGSWPSFLSHEYEQKGLHTVDYRIYWRPWFIGILVVDTIFGPFPLPFAFGANQISHTSIGTHEGGGPGGTYQVDESRGTLEG